MGFELIFAFLPFALAYTDAVTWYLKSSAITGGEGRQKFE